MSKATIQNDPTQRGGHALIRITDSAARGLGDPRFRLSREGYDTGAFGPGGWQVGDALLTPLDARAEGADLVLSVGPAVVDLIESGVVMLAVPAAGFDEPVFWPEIPLSRGGQSSTRVVLLPGISAASLAAPIARPSAVQAAAITPPAELVPITAPTVPPPPVVEPFPRPMEVHRSIEPAGPRADAPPHPEPPVQPPLSLIDPVPMVNPAVASAYAPFGTSPDRPVTVAPGWGGLLPLALGGVLLIALAGGGAWWALHRSAPVTPPASAPAPLPTPVPMAPVPAVPPAPVTTPPPTAARDCTQGSVAESVACAPGADALNDVAQRRWDAGQPDQGLVLMQMAADRGSGAAALRLAQLYDPNGFHAGGPIGRPNPREAAQYYRRAAQAHQDAATAPRQALRQRLQADVENGDVLADLTLKDFWP
jgi:hypothetical protein